MMTVALLKFVVISSFVFAIGSSTEVSQSSGLWTDVPHSPHEERTARAIWLSSKSNPECSGGVYTLSAGEETELNSHRSYGHNSYPSDYQVSGGCSKFQKIPDFYAKIASK